MGAESSTMGNQTGAGCGSNANSCRACKNPFGDRHTDTVKVNMENLGEGKENSAPVGAAMKENAMKKAEKEEEEQRAADELRRQAEEQQKRRAAEEAEKRRLKQEEEERVERLRQEEEARRREQEEIRRRKLEEEQRRLKLEEQRKQALAELERQRRLEEMERQRQIEEEEARLAEEEEIRQRQEAEKARRTKQLRSFLEKTGFQSPNEKRVKKSMMSTSFMYPLHAAVELNNPAAVELLLWAGADANLANSKKKTPLMLATERNDKKNSHANVITLLSA